MSTEYTIPHNGLPLYTLIDQILVFVVTSRLVLTSMFSGYALKLTPHTYWQSVVNTINALGILVLPMDPLILLLGLTDTLNASKHIKLFLFYAMTMLDGRFSKWKSPAPPTVLSWKVAIMDLIYKLTYTSRNCPPKFDKIWNTWIDA